MTTIAYDGKTISAESRCVKGGEIVTNNLNKFHFYGNKLFVIAGSNHQIKEFIENFEVGKIHRVMDCSAILVEKGNNIPYYADQTKDGEFYKLPLVDANIVESGPIKYAIGSGADWAEGAMLANMDSRTAVEIACQKDPYSGGRILTFDVEKFEFIE